MILPRYFRKKSSNIYPLRHLQFYNAIIITTVWYWLQYRSVKRPENPKTTPYM